MSKIVGETGDLDALLSALNRSAERLQTLWFSFIGLSLFFTLSALTTTHRMLLLQEPQTLPLVNIKVPLLPFYVIAPVFFVVIHFYVLLMLVLLARSAWVFEERLRRQLPVASVREAYRARVENALFLQLLVGAKPERRGATGRLLAGMALITIAVAPVLTLVVIQMQFLPYHHFAITWLHRGLVLLDVLLVLLLWRGYRHRWGRPIPRSPLAIWRETRWRGVFASVRGLLTAALALFAAGWLTLVEGRWAGEPGLDPTEGLDVAVLERWGVLDAAARVVPYTYQTDPPITDAVQLAAKQRAGAVNFLTSSGFRPLVWAELIRDRLDLRGEVFVGADTLAKNRAERASRGADLPFVATIDLRQRNFTKVDFTAADLRGVDLSGHRTVLNGAILERALLQGANFLQADMRSAVLIGAQLQGAFMMQASLHEAHLGGADLRGADLDFARLMGASLFGARANGATFWNAKAAGATLNHADLTGALLTGVDLRGANLSDARMRGAFLKSAQMQGADLDRALLKGADLQDAQLIGADLSSAVLDLASFQYVYAWGMIPPLRASNDAYALATKLEPVWMHEPRGDRALKPVNGEAIDLWLQESLAFVKDETRRLAISVRFAALREAKPGDLEKTVRFWREQERRSAARYPDEASYTRAVATMLADIACEVDPSPDPDLFAFRGLIRNRLGGLPRETVEFILSRLKAGLLVPAKCPIAPQLTPRDWALLEGLLSPGTTE